MDKKIVFTTVPNEEGAMLWCVHYASSYYDDDSRMPGAVPIDENFFVLAQNVEMAIAKADEGIKKARKRHDEGAKEEIVATIVTLENLIPCRDRSNESRMGFFPTSKFTSVGLACEEDRRRYKLAVCLVPIKK